MYWNIMRQTNGMKYKVQKHQIPRNVVYVMASKITEEKKGILINNMRQLYSYIVKDKFRSIQYVGISFRYIREEQNFWLQEVFISCPQ